MADVVQDLARSWRPLALTDVTYKLISFALLTPATLWLARWVLAGADTRVVADVEIATFFLTTPIGVATLVIGSAIAIALTALEVACLMSIGVNTATGRSLGVRDALTFSLSRAGRILRLTMNMVVRLLAGLLPFVLVAALAYLVLLRRYDINYYLAERPAAFWVAIGIAAVLLVLLAALLIRTIARWAFALPLVLFENVVPRRALSVAAERSSKAGSVVIIVLASWAAVALLLLAFAGWLPELIGRALAPYFSGSLPALMLFITALALLWGVIVLVVSIINAVLFALVIVRLYTRLGEPRNPRWPTPATADAARAQKHLTAMKAGVATIAVLAVIAAAMVAVVAAARNQDVVVIAHRGSAATAPENTLAAFRLAAEQDTDFVELDVQESADGEVVVVHDADLMRVGQSPLKIWETSAADLRAVDVGSHAGPSFASERVPTLAEALAACKGRSRVIVELKSYGHDVDLEEKVVSIVEAAGMSNDTIFMSLNHDMVRTMKRLRPGWRSGALVATAIGDLTSLGADFLAVEARLATRALVRQAHRDGQEVYVWTVNDPAWMLSAMSRGVDGLITDKPDVAREVVARRQRMSDAQRVVMALLVRLGVRSEALGEQ